MIKAIFFDLDGTLLNSNKVIPESAITYLKRCRERGIKLFISTARLPKCRDTLGWSDEIKSLFNGGVFCNGAVTEIENTNHYLYVNEEVASEIIDAVKNYPDIYISVQMKNNVHAFNKPLPLDEQSLWGLDKDKTFSTENCIYVDVIKILIFKGAYYNGLQKLPDELINIISKLCGNRAAFYLTDKGKVIQINGFGVSKYKGIEKIRNILGFKKSECVVFGDDYNDLEMIKRYNNSVAMGNAVEEVKQAAAYVTEDNDSDGIEKALERILGGMFE